MPVDVEIADFPVALLADMVGEPAQREKVVRLKERQTVVGAEALACEHLLRDGLEPGIGNLESWLMVNQDSSRIDSLAR